MQEPLHTSIPPFHSSGPTEDDGFFASLATSQTPALPAVAAAVPEGASSSSSSSSPFEPSSVPPFPASPFDSMTGATPSSPVLTSTESLSWAEVEEEQSQAFYSALSGTRLPCTLVHASSMYAELRRRGIAHCVRSRRGCLQRLPSPSSRNPLLRPSQVMLPSTRM